MRMVKLLIWLMALPVAVVALVLAGAPQAVLREIAYQAALKGDMERAHEIYETLAAFGDPISRNNVLVLDYRAARFDNGMGLTRKERKKITADARDEFSILAQEGLPAAKYNYAMFYFRVRHDSRYYEHVKAVLKSAADQGDELSKTAYAIQLARPMTHRDNEERMRLLKALADEGNAAAASEYADTIRGRPDDYSDDEVQHYFLIAAEAGDLEAQNALGQWYDRDDNISWLERAAAQGSLRAMVSLGKYYEHHSDSVEPDGRRALNWYVTAIEHAVRPDPVPEMVLMRDGFRWRDVVFYRPSNLGLLETAARQAGNLLIAGEYDVKRDLKYAEELLRFADKRWNGASVLRLQLEHADASEAQLSALLCADTASLLRASNNEDERALAAAADRCEIRLFTWIDYLEARDRGELSALSEEDRDALLHQVKQSSGAYLVLRRFDLGMDIQDLRGREFVIPDGQSTPGRASDARADVIRLSRPTSGTASSD